MRETLEGEGVKSQRPHTNNGGLLHVMVGGEVTVVMEVKVPEHVMIKANAMPSQQLNPGMQF